MDLSGIAVFYTILTILAVVTWMTGISIIVYEFLREFRGTYYDSASHETEKFVHWKKIRNVWLKKGVRIMIIGFSFHALLLGIRYFAGEYFFSILP